MAPLGGVDAGHVHETGVDEQLERPDRGPGDQRRRIRQDRRASGPGGQSAEVSRGCARRGHDELEDGNAADDLRVARGLVPRAQPGVAALVLEEDDRVLVGRDVEGERDRRALPGTDIAGLGPVRSDNDTMYRVKTVAPQRIHQEGIDVASRRQVDGPRAGRGGAVGIGVRHPKPAADERRRRHTRLLRRRWKPPKDTKTPRVHLSVARRGEIRTYLLPTWSRIPAFRYVRLTDDRKTRCRPRPGYVILAGFPWVAPPPAHTRTVTSPRRADMSTTVLGAHRTPSLTPLENRSDTPSRRRLGARQLRR